MSGARSRPASAPPSPAGSARRAEDGCRASAPAGAGTRARRTSLAAALAGEAMPEALPEDHVGPPLDEGLARLREVRRQHLEGRERVLADALGEVERLAGEALRPVVGEVGRLLERLTELARLVERIALDVQPFGSRPIRGVACGKGQVPEPSRHGRRSPSSKPSQSAAALWNRSRPSRAVAASNATTRRAWSSRWSTEAGRRERSSGRSARHSSRAGSRPQPSRPGPMEGGGGSWPLVSPRGNTLRCTSSRPAGAAAKQLRQRE